jgi:hypothetical protein
LCSVNIHPVYSVHVCITRGIVWRVWTSTVALSVSTYTVWQFIVSLCSSTATLMMVAVAAETRCWLIICDKIYCTHVDLFCKFKYSISARIWDIWNTDCSTGTCPEGNITVPYSCVCRCHNPDELHCTQDGAPHYMALPVRQRIDNHFPIQWIGRRKTDVMTAANSRSYITKFFRSSFFWRHTQRCFVVT